MTIAMLRKIEKEIVLAILNDAVASGYSLNVHNGGDEMELPTPSTDPQRILSVMFATDDETLRFYKDGKPAGWVWLVYVNSGWDVVIDYTVNLEPVMKTANKISNEYY